MKVTKQKVNIFIALWRVIRLLIHFGIGSIRVFLSVKYYEESKKAAVLQKWSTKLLKLLDIELIVQGSLPNPLANMLIVSNHISWLDILIIFTVIKPRFVAKKEIASWPIIGQLTKAGDTIFIDRGNKRDIMQVNKQLSDQLSAGNCIAIFPEGTTSTGESVLPFKASLFEPIYQSKGQVLPVVIQYKDDIGNLNTAPTFAGDISLLASAWNILTCYHLKVELNFLPLLDTTYFTNRNELAIATQQTIAAYW